MTMRIVIINAGLSQQASTVRLGQLIEDQILAHTSSTRHVATVEWLDLRPLAHQIVDHLLTGFAPPDLERAHHSVSSAAGIVALTPTYQTSYSGLFKSFFDTLPDEALAGTPVLLGATGGTPRHAMMTESAMRPLMTHLHARPVTTALFVATEDWGAPAHDSPGDGGQALMGRVRRGVGEFLDATSLNDPRHTKVSVGSPLGASIAPTDPGKLHSTAENPQNTSPEWPGFVNFDTLLSNY